jgi:hypothetical protein
MKGSLGGGKSADALYEPNGSASFPTSDKLRIVEETVFRYNIVNDFLNDLGTDQAVRDYASFLIINLIPSAETSDLSVLYGLLSYVKEQVNSQFKKGNNISEISPNAV